MVKSIRFPKGIYQRGNKIWISYYSKTLRKTVRESSGLEVDRTNIQFAKALRLERIKEAKMGVLADLIEITLSRGLNIFFRYKKDLAANTKDLYEYAVDYTIEKLGDKRIENYKEIDFIELFYYWENEREKKLIHNSCSIYSRHLSVLFNFFVTREFIKKNPVKPIPIKKKKIVTIPQDELEKILKYLYVERENIDAYDLIYFLYLTGFRIGEALTLKWRDINFDLGIISVKNHKAKREEVAPLLSQLRPHLNSMKIRTKPTSEDDFIFVYRDRKCSFFSRAQISIQRQEKIAELRDRKFTEEEIENIIAGTKFEPKYNLHMLRKTYITVLSKCKEITPFNLQTLARHSNLKTTLEHYTERDIIEVGEIASKEVPFYVPNFVA